MNSQLFEYVRCPITKSRLSSAGEDIIGRLNQRVEAGNLRNRIDREVDTVIEAGLVNEDVTYLYLVTNGIPTLIPDEAISLAEVSGSEQ